MKSKIVPVTLVGGPQEVYARLSPRGRTVLLESSKTMPGLSGWSYVAGPALATLETFDDATALRDWTDSGLQSTWSDPFEAVGEWLARIASVPTDRPQGLDFTGGLIGYLSYDLARSIERLPVLALADPPLPLMRLHICDHVLAFDHAQAQWYFCCTSWPWTDAYGRESVWASTLEKARSMGHDGDPGGFSAGPMSSRTPAERYLAQVRKVLDYVAAGDIFQANLSHRLEGVFKGDAFALYQGLTALNPAPFSAYLEGDDFAIASVSPERFLRLAQGAIVARPIKGTRSRAADPALDELLRNALVESEKDRAENLMIVDLMRNDLGRVARTGSVHVERLFEIEAHPSVWQLVSTIRAQLREGLDAADLLRACWPPGSMTGAPKVRAMQIIESLEPFRRGPYAGGIGYFDVSGGCDLSVVIRTAVVHDQRVMVQVGGAIVADSDPQQELEETYAKGRLLLQVLDQGRTPTSRN